MKRMIRLFLVCAVLMGFGSFLFAQGTAETQTATTQKPMVAVSILPQQYFVDRIAGSLVDTVVLVGPGQSPHSYEPTPSQMEQLSKAKLWVLSGTDFELSLEPKIASMYDDLVIVDGTEGVTFRTMEAHHHDDGEASESEAEGINKDRHTWLGRQPAKIMAAHIRDALVSILPEHESEIDANYVALIDDIDSTFTRLHDQLQMLEGRTVFVYHPAFGYFLDEFGIEQEAVETGGKEPTAQAIGELIAEAKADKAAVIFVQSQFPVSAASTIAQAVGAQVVPLDPLAPDWLDNIKRIGEALLTASESVE